MDCQHMTTELLTDVVEQLRSDNVRFKRFRLSHGPDQKYFYYLDRTQNIYWATWELSVVRNLIEPNFFISNEILKMCRFLDVKQAISVASYAIELFDRFFLHLLSKMQCQALLSTYGIDKVIGKDLGYHLSQLNNYRTSYKFDFLYNQLYADDNHMPSFQSVYQSTKGQHIRFVCLAMCVFVSCKIEDKVNFPQLYSIQHMLRFQYQVPDSLSKLPFLASTEVRILELMKYQLNINTIHVHLQVLVAFMCRYLNGCGVAEEKTRKMEKTADLFLQNTYLNRVPILIRYFELETGTKFDVSCFEHIDRYENIARDKLLIAAGIVASTFWVIGVPNPDGSCNLEPQKSNSWALNFLAYFSGIDYRSINYCRYAVMNYALINDQCYGEMTSLDLNNNEIDVSCTNQLCWYHP